MDKIAPSIANWGIMAGEPRNRPTGIAGIAIAMIHTTMKRLDRIVFVWHTLMADSMK